MKSTPSTMPTRRSPRRRTDVQKLCSAIAAEPGQRASREGLRSRLGWDEAKLERVMQRAIEDPSCPVSPVRGGQFVRYRGSENRGGTNGVGLYNDVARILERYWGPRRKCREIEVTVVGRARLRKGMVWATPDVVMRCHPGRKSSPDAEKLAHAFEVETAKGFSIRSVYQAHAQGRGADFAWVLFDRGGCKPDGFEHPDWDRIVWAAKELGVGLVSSSNSNSVSTWHVAREAKRRAYTRAERRQFDVITGTGPA